MQFEIARIWQLPTRTLHFGELPLVMGILNVTPDSFSDGGRFQTFKSACDQAWLMTEQGADILDIGGESTRPYSTPVSVDSELKRVIPVIESLAGRIGIPISIDTSKARVAREALEAGAEIINDVTGLTGDAEMLDVALQSRSAVCAMHMQGSPTTMQDDPSYVDVVAEVEDYLQDRRNRLSEAGIPLERICLDPGIGFGKTHSHNLTLLSNCHRFLRLGCPILVGHSRKGFIGKVIANKDRDRTAGTIGVSLALARQQVQILRVHDVQATRDALQLFAASGGLR